MGVKSKTAPGNKGRDCPGINISLVHDVGMCSKRFLCGSLTRLASRRTARLGKMAIRRRSILIGVANTSITQSYIIPGGMLPTEMGRRITVIQYGGGLLGPIFAGGVFVGGRFGGVLLDVNRSNNTAERTVAGGRLRRLSIVTPPLSLRGRFTAFIRYMSRRGRAMRRDLGGLRLVGGTLVRRCFKWLPRPPSNTDSLGRKTFSITIPGDLAP